MRIAAGRGALGLVARAGQAAAAHRGGQGEGGRGRGTHGVVEQGRRLQAVPVDGACRRQVPRRRGEGRQGGEPGDTDAGVHRPWAIHAAAELSPMARAEICSVPAERAGPRMTQAGMPLTREIEVLDEYGERRRIHIPDERPLTVFVDKRELVTLMTLGAAPELLVLGYLRNQRLVDHLSQVESITVDWDVHAAAVRTVGGIEAIEAKTARRV